MPASSSNAATQQLPPVSKFAPLPPGPTATIDPAQAPEFPTAQPVIALWRGGGEPPRTEVSVRIWQDGTIRFTCGRRGTLPVERVAAIVDAFAKLGWTTAQPTPPTPPDPTCITSSVQISHGGATHRRNSPCGATVSDEAEAIAFVRSVLGPDPC
jgi:hypothetical protein